MEHKDICVIVIGMSGTGKTTFKFSQSFDNVFCINLDPAVKVIGYKPIIDIRQTHEYRKIMKQFKLGPNGAILTALNLFAAQPQNIVNKISETAKKHCQKKNVFLIDIPGQIQVFTWSSSSLILTEAINTLMPVSLFYTIDSQRCQNPNIFLSNLLFAQSIQYRLLKFPFKLLLNKCDCCESDKLVKWLQDYEVFMAALNEDQSYLSTLSRSVVIHLSEFYEKMDFKQISAKTGTGIQQLYECLFKKL